MSILLNNVFYWFQKTPPDTGGAMILLELGLGENLSMGFDEISAFGDDFLDHKFIHGSHIPSLLEFLDLLQREGLPIEFRTYEYR